MSINLPSFGGPMPSLRQVSIPFDYSRVPTSDAYKLEKAEEAVKEDTDLELWIQEAMAQVAALQQYGVICIILTGFAFSGLVSLDHSQIKLDMDFKIGNLHVGSGIVFCLVLSLALCISCGLYATLVFTLASIYGAVAVSHGDQRGFIAFMRQTGTPRIWAFRAFKGAMVFMVSSIMFLLLTKVPLLDAIGVMIPSLAVVCAAIWHASYVMSVAHAEFEHPSLAAFHRDPSATTLGKEQDGEDEESLGPSARLDSVE